MADDKSDMSPQWVEAEFPATAAMLVHTGFAFEDSDGKLTITDEGCNFLRKWLDKQGMS